jgi:hypothetical protein
MYGWAHFLRQRSLAVLLKSQGLNSPQIALKVNLCQQSIKKRFGINEPSLFDFNIIPVFMGLNFNE